MIGLRGLGDYEGASTITLFDGTVVTDPANTPATQADCTPYWCGANPTDLDVRYWCAYWGNAGSPIACQNPQCTPYLSAIPAPACHPAAVVDVPVNTPAVTPTVQPVTLTPQNIVQPLPDISQANAPVTIPPPASCWCNLNQMINDYPVLALLALGAAALLLTKGGRK